MLLEVDWDSDLWQGVGYKVYIIIIIISSNILFILKVRHIQCKYFT